VRAARIAVGAASAANHFRFAPLVWGGLETTRPIRADELEAGGRVPIVALTANAMQGDRERCLAAGMDDDPAKPFRQAELADIVERWAGPRDRRSDFLANMKERG